MTIRAFVRPSSPQALLTAGVLAALSVPAAAQLQFEELPRKGLPAVSDETRSIALGDIDGDGDIDIVIGNALWNGNGGQNRLYVNDGSGTFSDATASRLPVHNDLTTSIALGDVDGDGDVDMVIGNGTSPFSSGQNRLYLNDGTGTFADATANQMPLVSDYTSSVALGDVDGDGDLDMVAGNYFQQNRLYLNNGTGTFSDATASQMPVDNDKTISVALGDVDGDGDLDMVLGNYAFYTGQQNRLYLNDGTGTFSDVTLSRMPPIDDKTRSVALGDVDGDGDLDIVVGNDAYYSYAGQTRLYLNDGTGTFVDATASQMPTDNDMTNSLALGDVDGDGALDLLITNRGNNQNRLYLNDGTGVFSDATSSRISWVNGYSVAVAFGDADGDGDLDVVIGNGGLGVGGSGQNRIYLNLQRQLHAPTAPQIGQPYGLDAYLRYGPASTVDLAAIYLSTAPASIALPPFGTLGIDLTQAAPFPTLIIPQPAGVGTVSWTLPNLPSLVGQVIYSQAMLIAYPNDLRLSNVVREVIQ